MGKKSGKRFSIKRILFNVDKTVRKRIRLFSQFCLTHATSKNALIYPQYEWNLALRKCLQGNQAALFNGYTIISPYGVC